jgi:flap endonuclease-1
MGVDIKPLIDTLAKTIKLENLRGKVIAIDAYNALYQFLATIRGYTGEPLMDSHGRVTSHLSGLFYRSVNLLSLGIKLVYVFDGKPPSLKYRELDTRRRVKEEAMVMYEQALQEGRLDDARKYAQATSILKDYMVNDAKTLLSLMGIPYVQAPAEGEATAAYMSKVGIAYATASQDYDSLLFGSTRLIRNLAISGKRKLPNKNVYVDVEPEMIELEHLLNSLSITREELVDIAILIGTDYNPDGFKGIGAKKALQLIKKYKRLEGIEVESIQEGLKQIDYNAIRRIFLEPEVAKVDALEFKEIDKEGIIKFLCSERDFSKERVSSALERLEQAMKISRSGLERWF